jgi:hypothetical protein
MRTTVRSLMGANLLALTGLLGLGAGTARAQVVYYGRPTVVAPRYYGSGVPYGDTVPAPGFAYADAPRAYHPAPPNPVMGGRGYHYCYFPALRELPLYKPWLPRD